MEEVESATEVEEAEEARQADGWEKSPSSLHASPRTPSRPHWEPVVQIWYMYRRNYVVRYVPVYSDTCTVQFRTTGHT